MTSEQYQQKLVVDKGGIRIDVWLGDNIDSISRSRLQKLISEGQVIVNQQVCESKKLF